MAGTAQFGSRIAERRRGRAARASAAALLVTLAVVFGTPTHAQSAVSAQTAGDIELLFFWSERCPHCQRARPFVEALPSERSWLTVRSLEVSGDLANLERYVAEAAALGHDARAVPAFVFCGQLYTGFDDPSTTGAFLAERLAACHAERAGGGPAAHSPAGESLVHLPLLGAIDPGAFSLPVLTVVLAGLDSFNPCAFFVLLFLLSLLVHARSRARILLVGGVFVLCSGLVYFLFMAAWLSLFLVVGQLRLVTALAGAIAVGLAAMNIKEYFWFGQGPSLSIPEQARPGLFRRMRALVGADRLLPTLIGTLTLAVAANSFELLCTAGFPMVYTRALTLAEIGPAQRVMYLALYNVIYVVPLAIVVVVFARTLGSRKLAEREGRVLKLASGLMMLGLGLILLLAPALLDNVLVAVGMLAGAVILTVAIERLSRPRAAGSGGRAAS